MSKVKRFSLEERYGYQNRKVIYDKNSDNDIELNNIYPIIDLFNQLDEQIADLEAKLAEKEKIEYTDTINFVETSEPDIVAKELDRLNEQLAEKEKENATLEAMLVENANDIKTMQEFKIGEDEYDLTDEDARNSLCWEVKELKQQLEEKERLLQYGKTEIKKLHKRINDIVKRDEKLFKSQPAEIIEKIKKQIFNHFNVKNMEEYENLSLIDSLFTADVVIEMLDTILKEYQK